MGIFTLRIGKNECDIGNKHPKISHNAKIVQNKKKRKKKQQQQKKKQTKTKFRPKMPYLGISLKKYCHIFSILKFAKMINFMKKIKVPKSATSNFSF